MSACRVRQWCKACATKITILGNGWHVAAAKVLVEEVLVQAVHAKQGKKVQQLDYGTHAVHQCNWNCRYKMKLGDVNRMVKTQKAATASDSYIIDV